MRQLAEIEVSLPNGHWRDGVCVREVAVRAIPEGDAALTDDLAAFVLPVERVSSLLRRCVTPWGGRAWDETDWIRNLVLGDREALLVQIRRLTFGDCIPCTLQCPACSQFMDFELEANQLVLPAGKDSPQFHEEEFLVNGIRWRVRFRIPRASDVETALYDAQGRPEDAVSPLLHSCIDWVVREPREAGDAMPVTEWPTDIETQISARMAELDPQAEITLQLDCPACGHRFCSAFDTADYLFQELETRERQLIYDVHRLALAYHWSEGEILSMPPRKRRIYLELLEEGFSGE